MTTPSIELVRRPEARTESVEDLQIEELVDRPPLDCLLAQAADE
jgi:hypothetical protein